MILDRVDFSHIASTFKLRGYTYTGCAPVSLSMPNSQGHDAASRERDMFELAKQRRRADAEQARLKLAKKEARSRIRQVEEQRQNQDIDIRTPKRSAEIAERDSAVFFSDDLKTVSSSNAETIAKIVSKWRARTRWSKALQKDSRVIDQFVDEPAEFGKRSSEASFERSIVTVDSEKRTRCVD
ncbi:hypothetical protein KCU81_g5370, partial [Aureobasidium melanogenum]|uniref:Uncharacterized protein n=1 Tax=Aureobasidium melanogenum (strain CBS 110374) TaxID=1043003 RepID=A0A074VZM4_AURM1